MVKSGWGIAFFCIKSNVFWLVVWNMNLIFSFIWNNHPNWLSCFSEGLKPPTRYNIHIFTEHTSWSSCRCTYVKFAQKTTEDHRQTGWRSSSSSNSSSNALPEMIETKGVPAVSPAGALCNMSLFENPSAHHRPMIAKLRWSSMPQGTRWRSRPSWSTSDGSSKIVCSSCSYHSGSTQICISVYI